MNLELICDYIEREFSFLVGLGFLPTKSEETPHEGVFTISRIYKNSATGLEVDLSLFLHPDDFVIPVVCISNGLGGSFTLLDWSFENIDLSKFAPLIIDGKKVHIRNISAFLDGVSNVLRGPLVSTLLGLDWHPPKFGWKGYK